MIPAAGPEVNHAKERFFLFIGAELRYSTPAASPALSP